MACSRPLRAVVAAVTAGVVFITTLPVPAQARLISTDAVLAGQETDAERQRVQDFLARADVRQQMQSLGVSADEASSRVAALSDQEIHRIAGQLPDEPAGGDGLGVIIGAAVLIFVILLITDIAGLTKVFPWTRSVR
ncbi:MAG: PA2779 family protein [Rhodospirillaceae bacterium]|nr:PA2779 family protein [Rhodospirillales bacterium]